MSQPTLRAQRGLLRGTPTEDQPEAAPIAEGKAHERGSATLDRLQRVWAKGEAQRQDVSGKEITVKIGPKEKADMDEFRSDLATLVGNHQDVRDRPNPKAFGVMIHTTGRGLLDRARRERISPMEAAINVYTAPGAYFPHYVVHGNEAVQIADERERASHAGVPASQRRLYLSGQWESMVPKKTLKRWRKRWPGFKSPSHLYPGRSPNACYIGIEMIPKRDATFSWPTVKTAARLTEDIMARHGIDPGDDLDGTGYPQLVGHEDVEPLERWNRFGGWDPGALRAKPLFIWDTFHGYVAKARLDRLNGQIEELEDQLDGSAA